MANQQQALEEAARRAALWECPYLADADVPAALNCPPTLWHQHKRIGDTPPLFTLGRRVFVRTADLRAWLDKKAAAGAPGSRRHRERVKVPA